MLHGFQALSGGSTLRHSENKQRVFYLLLLDGLRGEVLLPFPHLQPHPLRRHRQLRFQVLLPRLTLRSPLRLPTHQQGRILLPMTPPLLRHLGKPLLRHLPKQRLRHLGKPLLHRLPKQRLRHLGKPLRRLPEQHLPSRHHLKRVLLQHLHHPDQETRPNHQRLHLNLSSRWIGLNLNLHLKCWAQTPRLRLQALGMLLQQRRPLLQQRPESLTDQMT